MLIWANLHGAFIAGFVTWLVYGIGIGWDALSSRLDPGGANPAKFLRYYLLGGGLAFLASLMNPSGIGLWKNSLAYIGNRYLVNHTMEYLPADFHDPRTWSILIFIGLWLVVMGLKKNKMEAGSLFTAAAWLLMGLYSLRNIPLFALSATPLLAQGLEEIFIDHPVRLTFLDRLQQLDARLVQMDARTRGPLWLILAVLIATAGLQAGVRLDASHLGNRFDPQVFPVAAVDWLETHPQKGEMFNYFTWGGYLLYRGWPDERVFIDGQTDFYGEDLTRQYGQVIDLEKGWESVIDRYQVGWAILPVSEPAGYALRQELGWELIYKDGTAVILRKKD